ncbi:MAG: DUF192 domain-containing protein [Actinomycetota bacterium]
MAWLVRDGEVLCSLEIADSGASRRTGLLGRDGIEGALLLTTARSVHTVGMRFALDVGYLDGDLVVVDLTTMGRHRIGRPRFGARSVIEAEAGSFERWGLAVGQRLEVKR